MLGDEVRLESFCHHCATPITIELRDGRATRVEPEETLVYLVLRPTEWWENIVTTSSNTMVFFASPEHRDLDYARPTRDELLEHFAGWASPATTGGSEARPQQSWLDSWV